MKKTLFIILFMLIGAAQGANQKETDQKISANVFAVFKKAKDDLDICSIKYVGYLLKVELARMKKEVEISEAAAASGTGRFPDLQVSTQDVIDDIEPIHKSCVDNAKIARISEASKALAGIKKTRTKELAKETLAQWITAIDAIGLSNGKTESDKFNSLVNRLIIELTN